MTKENDYCTNLIAGGVRSTGMPALIFGEDNCPGGANVDSVPGNTDGDEVPAGEDDLSEKPVGEVDPTAEPAEEDEGSMSEDGDLVPLGGETYTEGTDGERGRQCGRTNIY